MPDHGRLMECRGTTLELASSLPQKLVFFAAYHLVRPCVVHETFAPSSLYYMHIHLALGVHGLVAPGIVQLASSVASATEVGDRRSRQEDPLLAVPALLTDMIFLTWICERHKSNTCCCTWAVSGTLHLCSIV